MQELTNPEEGEDLDVCHILLLLAKGDTLKLGSSLWLSDLSRTEKISKTVDGEQDPGESNNSGNEWHYEELQVSDNDNGGGLEDGN